MNPSIISRGTLKIAGVSGDGSGTMQLWQSYERLAESGGPSGKLSNNGYEIRIYEPDESRCDCHVGVEVSGGSDDPRWSLVALPASLYASFTVFVSKGYDSENATMDMWLRDHSQEYRQRELNGRPYIVECYDERFDGTKAGSVVEIWIPVVKVNTKAT